MRVTRVRELDDATFFELIIRAEVEKRRPVGDRASAIVDQRGDVLRGRNCVDRAVDVTDLVELEGDEVLARIDGRRCGNAERERRREKSAQTLRHAKQRNSRHQTENRKTLRDEPNIAVALRHREIEEDARDREQRIGARGGLALVAIAL